MSIGVVREAHDDDGQALPVSRQCFQHWMDHVHSEAMAGDEGFPIGRRVLELRTSEVEEESVVDSWDVAANGC